MGPQPPLRYRASVQDWFSVIIGIGHDRTVRLVLELDGRVDQPRLAHALRIVRVAEPIIDCRFVPMPFSAHWRLREDRDTLELCTLVETSNVKRDLDAFMAIPIDPMVDPLIQVRVFRAENDTVCLKLSHAVMDGGGFKLLVERLTALYRALATDPDSVIPPDLVTDRGQSQVMRLFSLTERLRAFLTQPFHKKTWAFPYVGHDRTGVTFTVRTVDIPIATLRAATKTRGASITDAIVASFARAFFEITEVPTGLRVPFTLAIDLRRYLAAPEAAGLVNLSSLTWIELERHSDFAPILADVHASLGAAMKDKPGVGLAMVMDIVSVMGYGIFHFANGIRARMARAQGKEFPSLSNIGVMDPAVLDFGDAPVRDARFFPPVCYPPTFCIVSGSYKDRLYFSASYPRGAVPGDMMERFLDCMVAQLDHLA